MSELIDTRPSKLIAHVPLYKGVNFVPRPEFLHPHYGLGDTRGAFPFHFGSGKDLMNDVNGHVPRLGTVWTSGSCIVDLEGEVLLGSRWDSARGVAVGRNASIKAGCHVVN